jgi:hypothetical protein
VIEFRAILIGAALGLASFVIIGFLSLVIA